MKRSNIISAIIFFLLLYVVSIAQSENDGTKGFRASVVKINITPKTPQYLLGYHERVSTGVHDSIYHRIVALDDGEKQFFLVSTELCIYSPVEYDKLAERIQQELNIEPVNFWWTLTHTHSAPEFGDPGLNKVFMGERFRHEIDIEYTEWVEQKIIDGIKEARKKLAPARLGAGWGSSRANINRRAKDIDGTVSLGMDPDGPVDRRIGLMRIDNVDGSPMVLIANYPMHGTVLGKENLEISGDAPGVVSEYVEKQIGAPLVFVNGAAGDIAPLYSVYPNPKKGHLSQFRVLLGNNILEANKAICNTTDNVSLYPAELIVETPRKVNLGWPDDFDKYNRTTNTGENLVRLPVRVLKINNDIVIWGAPLELFCEISNEIRSQSPFPFTFYFGYTNGWLGYLCTKSGYEQGGYESHVSPFTPKAVKYLTENVVSYMRGEINTRPEYPIVK